MFHGGSSSLNKFFRWVEVDSRIKINSEWRKGKDKHIDNKMNIGYVKQHW